MRPALPARGALLELTFWPAITAASLAMHSRDDNRAPAVAVSAAPWPAAIGALRVRAHLKLDSARTVALDVLVNSTAQLLTIGRTASPSLGAHDIRATGKPQGGIVAASWNMLRLLVQQDGRVRVWLNPQFSDVTGASVPPADEAQPPVPMPPRIDALDAELVGAELTHVEVAALDGTAHRIDYMSVLPPVVVGG